MHLKAGEIRSSLEKIRADGPAECVLFSSEERTEFYKSGSDAGPPAETLMRLLLSGKNEDFPLQSSHFFSYTGSAAIEHLFRVSAGLDSMIVGESEDITALREAIAIARETQCSGLLLDHVFEAALQSHTQVHEETHLAEGAVSVAHAAIELAQRIFDDLRTRNALMLGIGETAQMTAKLLHKQGIGSLMVTHKTPGRAESLATAVNGVIVPFETFRAQLLNSDIIISSVQSALHLLTSKDIKGVQRGRSGRTLFMVDCGIPRNIDPFAGELENVFLYDVDMLNAMVSENIARRRTHIPRAEEVVREQLQKLQTWYSSLESTASTVTLNDFIERIRAEEVSKEMPKFKPHDRPLVDELTKRIARRIADLPEEYLRGEPESEHPERLRTGPRQKLFGPDTGKKDSSENQ